jgi:thioredoxin reductase
VPLDDPRFVWGMAALVVGAILLPYLLLFRRQRKTDKARKQEATALGIDRPMAQFPFVDAQLCIGCGACVDACPEGDVLGIVGGTAVVINGLKCVGHGRCELACPVGAIEVGLGDLKSRRDVPLMDDAQETSVPGLYVAGELSGLALVRNAMGQGQKVVSQVIQRLKDQPDKLPPGVLDLIIVGAGPAGLAAAATASQAGLRYVVLEQEKDLGGTIYHYPRRKLVLVQAVEVPLLGRMKEAEYSKEDLLLRLTDLMKRARLQVRFGEKVSSVSRQFGLFTVTTPSGATQSRFVVLALGRRGTPRKLGVPGEELPKVMYQLVDAESYKGVKVLVVGGGDSAVEAAIGLARDRRNQVTLSYRREKLVRIKQKNEQRLGVLMKQGLVRPMFGSEVLEVRPDSVLLRVGDGEPRDLPNDFVFVFAGGEPPFGLLQQAGVRFGGEARAAS